jgi:hypothetical protein
LVLPVEKFNLGKVYGIKCVDIGDVLREEASQTLLTEGSQYHNLTGVVKESQHQFKFHPNPAQPVHISSKPCPTSSNFIQTLPNPVSCKDLKLSDTHPKQMSKTDFCHVALK